MLAGSCLCGAVAYRVDRIAVTLGTLDSAFAVAVEVELHTETKPEWLLVGRVGNGAV